MVKKRIFLSLVLLCVVSIPSLTAWSMAQEYVDIQNNLFVIIIINSLISIACHTHLENTVIPKQATAP